ncbi:MAG: hypothetical protein WBC70_05040 [Candidatus Aminicenantales bacterium]
MDQQRPGMFRAALIGGVVAGVLTAIPLVNCFCCLWIIGGAMLAAYLLAKDSAAPLTPGDGAVVGILAGIIAAVADAVASLPFETMNREYVQRFMDQLSQFVDEMPAGWENWMEKRAGELSPAWFLLGLLASAVIYAALGALGGTIGVSIFSRKKSPRFPPPGAPDEKAP